MVDESNLPGDLTVTARTEAGAIMGISHNCAEIHGVQFHPESIASVAGYRILAQFLDICGRRYREIVPKFCTQRQMQLIRGEIVHHEFRRSYVISP